MSRVLGMSWLAGVFIATSSAPALAGGGWIPDPGHGYVYLGGSRKTADSSWTPSGDYRLNVTGSTGKVSWHDFRYLYLGGEVGIFKHASIVITPTWLYGLEGPKDDYEKNVGLSDAWIGFKYGFRRGAWPMALGFNHRTPYFYDVEGPYDRHLYDANGQFRGVSPEWRGLLKHDYSLSYFVSRSIARHRGWASLEGGYTWRDGAPADQIYFSGDVGHPLPFWSAKLKAAAHLEVSLGNDTPRQPDDRFGASPTNNFNNASYLKLGGGAFIPFGPNREWTFELGYNQWVWGHSARRYHEPYVSVGRSF